MRSRSLRWAMTNKKMAGVRPPPHRLDPQVYLQVSSDPSQDEPANVGERDTDRKTRYLRNLACPGAHGLCSIRPHMKLRAHGFRNRAITPPAVTFDTWYCHSQRVGLVYLHPHGEDAGAIAYFYRQDDGGLRTVPAGHRSRLGSGAARSGDAGHARRETLSPLSSWLLSGSPCV
jgi:hypothetical protein